MQTCPVFPQSYCFNERLRQAMRSRIYVILQRKYHVIRTGATLEEKLRSLSYHIEAKLMNLAKSEEEYLDLQDLEVRIHYALKELKERRSSSQRPAMNVVASHGIDALPDSLISQILLWLPTKDSVKTSVLSSRWRNLWLDVPGLELDLTCLTPSLSEAAAINNLIDRFMESRLQKFKIKYDDPKNVSLFGSRKLIATVINLGVEHLDVESFSIPRDSMPLDIYKSKTLVSLKLAYVRMSNPGFVVSLPCLKIMQLENIMCRKGDPLIIENLISRCPVLEDLNLCWDGGYGQLPVLRVRSQSLKRFCVRSSPWGISSGKEYAVEIDAPRLKYINFRDEHTHIVVAKNMSSLFMIDIDARFNVAKMKKGIISDFLDRISGVLHPYFKHGLASKFRNLSRLEATFCNLLLRRLPDFLESFPKLKHLTLYLVYMKELEPENLELTNVPPCLLSTLECVEIKEVIAREEEEEETVMQRERNNQRTLLKQWHKKTIWMEAVRYILENSSVLKKLILCFSPKTIQVSKMSKSLDAFTKRSPKCEVFIRWTTSLARSINEG